MALTHSYPLTHTQHFFTFTSSFHAHSSYYIYIFIAFLICALTTLFILRTLQLLPTITSPQGSINGCAKKCLSSLILVMSFQHFNRQLILSFNLTPIFSVSSVHRPHFFTLPTYTAFAQYKFL